MVFDRKPKLTLIRGISGSGKSTLARKLNMKDEFGWTRNIEADQYFYVKRVVPTFDSIDIGASFTEYKYKFDPRKLKQAHEDCFSRVEFALSLGFNVYVSNTFIKLWEAKKYFDLCKENSYDLDIVQLTNDFGSIHAPDDVVSRQKKNFRFWGKKSDYEYIELETKLFGG